MNASEIKDEKTLQAWLETRPQAEGLVMRAVLRVLPFAFSDMKNISANHIVSILLRRSLEKSRLLSQKSSSSAEMAPRFHEHDAAAFIGRSIGSHETLMVFDASLLFWSASLESGYITSLVKAVSITLSAADPRADSYWQQISQANSQKQPALRRALWDELIFDCSAVERNRWKLSLPLWHDQIPEELPWDRTRALWSAPNSPYAFWLRWYEAVLRGETLNPELERDIALIPDEDWEKGADHIAAKIALVEERYDLKAQVVALKQQLTLQQSSIATAQHRSHNQPPELIDAGVTLQRQITIIFDTLDEAEEELAKTNPSPSRLKRIGQRLIDLAASVVKYCGKIADKGLVAAVVAGSTAAGTIGAAKLISHLNEVEIKGSAICKYAGKLLSGS